MAPAIIFFDELDSLVGKRVEGRQTDEVTARILSSFLTEMDGLELARGVLVMGATNRPQALDAALIRSGGRRVPSCLHSLMSLLAPWTLHVIDEIAVHACMHACIPLGQALTGTSSLVPLPLASMFAHVLTCRAALVLQAWAL